MSKENDKDKPKKLEFSKIIFLCTSIMYALVVIGSFILMWYVQSTEALVCLISTSAAMVTSNLALYTWKAKAENIIKLSKDNNLTIQETKALVGEGVEYEEEGYTGDI